MTLWLSTFSRREELAVAQLVRTKTYYRIKPVTDRTITYVFMVRR